MIFLTHIVATPVACIAGVGVATRWLPLHHRPPNIDLHSSIDLPANGTRNNTFAALMLDVRTKPPDPSVTHLIWTTTLQSTTQFLGKATTMQNYRHKLSTTLITDGSKKVHSIYIYCDILEIRTAGVMCVTVDYVDIIYHESIVRYGVVWCFDTILMTLRYYLDTWTEFSGVLNLKVHHFFTDIAETCLNFRLYNIYDFCCYNFRDYILYLKSWNFYKLTVTGPRNYFLFFYKKVLGCSTSGSRTLDLRALSSLVCHCTTRLCFSELLNNIYRPSFVEQMGDELYHFCQQCTLIVSWSVPDRAPHYHTQQPPFVTVSTTTPATAPMTAPLTAPMTAPADSLILSYTVISHISPHIHNTSESSCHSLTGTFFLIRHHVLFALVALISVVLLLCFATGGSIIQIHVHHHHVYNDISNSNGTMDDFGTNGHDVSHVIKNNEMYYGTQSRIYDVNNGSQDMKYDMNIYPHGGKSGGNLSDIWDLPYLPPTSNIITVMMATTDTPDQQNEPNPKDGDTPIEDTEVENTEHQILNSTQNLLTQSPFRSPSSKLARRLRTTSETSASSLDSITSMSSSQSIPSGSSEIKSGKRDKWINEDGKYFLDKQQECGLNYIKSYMDQDDSDLLMKELSTLLMEHCKPENNDRFRVQFGSNKVYDSPKPRSKKIPICQVNIQNDNELSKLILCYKEKTESAIQAIFDMSVEFDCILVNKLSSDKDFISYESFFDNNQGEFSPTVAILSLGTTRPMYIKPNTGSNISHKVVLHPGTLCVLTGQTEGKYIHSVPKNFGQLDQMTIFFIERPPSIDPQKSLVEIKETSTGTELPAIIINKSPDSSPVYTKIPPPITAESILTPPPDTTQESNSSDSVLKSSDSKESTEASIFRFDKESTEFLILDKSLNSDLPTKTPITVKPSDDYKIIRDEIDFEADDCLLLAESINTVINEMSGDSVNIELTRNKSSIWGSIQARRRRLNAIITMKIGEMSRKQSPEFDPIQLMRMESTDVSSFSGIKEDFEALVTTQNNIECSMTTFVDTLSELKTELSDLRSSITSKEFKENQKTEGFNNNTPNNDHITCSNHLKTISDKVLDLDNKISDIKGIKEDISALVDTQDNMERSMTTFMGIMNIIKTDLNDLRSNMLHEPKKNQIVPELNTTINNDIINCTNQFKILDNKVSDLNKEIIEIHDHIDLLNNTVLETKRDLQSWYNSAFYHEDSKLIEEIHKLLTTESVTDPPVLNSYVQQTQTNIYVSNPEDYPPEIQDNVSPSASANNSSNTNTEMGGYHNLDDTVQLNKKPVVCLITDSIMRHVVESDIGDKYIFHRVDKRCSSELSDERLRSKLQRLKPHFVYVHLGINDIHNGTSTPRILNYFADFEMFASEKLKESKVIFSLPLLNGNMQNYGHISELRNSITRLVNTFDTQKDVMKRRLFHNSNLNFFEGQYNNRHHTNIPQQQVARLFNISGKDPVHLSERGKATMICVMRNALHKILRKYKY